MLRSLCLILFLVVLTASGAIADFRTDRIPYRDLLPKDRLLVVVSFDGSRDLQQWQEILDFARREQVKMTFYVSGVYFLADTEKSLYRDPFDPQQTGNSLIGFGGDAAQVERRKTLIRSALQEGHDIESHLNGHFDAKRWSETVWEREFAAFAELSSFLPQPPRHVRFPLLAMNRNVYPVMTRHRMLSILSVADKNPDEVRIVTDTGSLPPYRFLELPIPQMEEGGGRFLLMDYNIYLHDQARHRSPEAAEAATVRLYLDEAQRSLAAGRPLFLSHHFSGWNDNAYWRALQTTILRLKNEIPVEFVTISELCDRLAPALEQVAQKERPNSSS